MHDFNWDDVRIFLSIVEYSSLSKAAEALGINQSTVGRRISALEQHLKVALFERQRGARWVLTAAGEQMLSAAELMSDSANTIVREVVRNSTEVRGHVTVTCAEVGARYLTVPALGQLAARYPDLHVSLNVSNDLVDLTSREADVALRIAESVPQDMLATRVCSVSIGVYGTQHWYDKFVAGERALPLITWMKDGEFAGMFSQLIPDGEVRYRTNNTQAMLGFARQGLGIAPLSCYEANESPELIRFDMFPLMKGPGLWVLSHSDLRTTARVRLVRDAMVAELKKIKPLIEIEPEDG
ncbi:MAG: LysR family transcriptional regulator [Pseudomonadota bacterium]